METLTRKIKIKHNLPNFKDTVFVEDKYIVKSSDVIHQDVVHQDVIHQAVIHQDVKQEAEDEASKLIDNQVFEYFKLMNAIKDGSVQAPKPSPLQISTISAKCRLSAEINLVEMNKIFYQLVVDNIMLQKNSDYFIQGFQLGTEIIGLFKKLEKKQAKIKTKIVAKDEKNIDFYNQCTLLLYSDYNNNQINLKLFRNGSITMTGCKDANAGPYVINKLVDEMKKYEKIFNYDEDQNDLHMSDFNITMINSNYYIGYRIDLKKIETILTENYQLFYSYDPKIYAAVKISFMWNKNKPLQKGICNCETKCIVSKKKSVKIKNNCSIITISIFNSGQIIITGSNSYQKTYDAYNFINTILTENYANIVKFSIHDCITTKETKKGKKGRPKKDIL